uniref:Oleosin n=1 Tax=Oryza brachyantha TaxID=4533 RepID=J3LRV2_ORYBR
MQASTRATYSPLLPTCHRSRHLYMPTWPPLLVSPLHLDHRLFACVFFFFSLVAGCEAGAGGGIGAMADRDRAGQYYQQQRGQVGEAVKGILPDKAPSASQALTVATLFPLGGLLLVLSGLALAASVVGLAVATPVFLLFSPVLVPAALLIGLAVAGFLTSGALGLDDFNIK